MATPVSATPDIDIAKRTEGQVDLAARRKRPRPAALGSAALRSRSYGAPSMSPTFRYGAQPPTPHVVRHVKSTGQNLNVMYSGIRKTSSAQRSPLNTTTFAEAQAFNRLMTQSAQTAPGHRDAAAPPTPISSDELLNRVPLIENDFYAGNDQETPNQYLFNRQSLHLSMASPPSTPLKTGFLVQGQVQQMLPPVSVPPQYAMIPDYTPPYSAGPLTGSSWSDAPLTSPEISVFPSAMHMPQAIYPAAHDFTQRHYQPFMLPPEPKAELILPGNVEQKPTEFFIQEFPRQREEHAHAAQQLAQQKPKSYTFANATPSDF